MGKSAISRFSAGVGRKAKKAQKSIQVQSTPKSVQDKIICVSDIVADGFMGTSSLNVQNFFADAPKGASAYF